MDALEREFQNLQRRIDIIRQQQAENVGPCTTCKHAGNSKTFYRELMCYNPLVATPYFDSITGEIKQIGIPAKHARSGLCGENGSMHHYGFFAWYSTSTGEERMHLFVLALVVSLVVSLIAGFVFVINFCYD